MKLKIGRWLANYLSAPIPGYEPFCVYDVPLHEGMLQPADILLVEGNTRISQYIKYLTQSTWSHAAFYAGAATGQFTEGGESCPLVEAEISVGVRASPLSKYRHFNTRVCRPVNLTKADAAAVVEHMVDHLGADYNLRHIYALAKHLCGKRPASARHWRHLSGLHRGDPERAICSSLIAEGFHAIGYPILPIIETRTSMGRHHYSVQEILYIRHHSLFTPRDFDVSPYFNIIKPTLVKGFDYSNLHLDASHALEHDQEGLI